MSRLIRFLYLSSICTGILLLIVIICELTPLGYDRVEFDFTTGQTRYTYRVCGIIYRSTPTRDIAKTPWLARELRPGENHEWALLRYLNGGAPRINTFEGKLYSRVQSVGTLLELYETETPGRELLAEFILDRLGQAHELGSEADRAWAELEYVFESLDTYVESLPYHSFEDVQALIEKSEMSASE